MSAERWMAKAGRFEEEARDNLRSGRYDLACFSAQQASELRLKGLLITITGAKPYTHLLTELAEALQAAGIDVPEEVKRCCISLEEHYLQARYPDARMNEYRRDEAEEALKCMEVIGRFVEEVLRRAGSKG